MSLVRSPEPLDVSALIKLVGEDKIREHMEKDDYFITHDGYYIGRMQIAVDAMRIRGKNLLRSMLFNDWLFLNYFFEMALWSTKLTPVTQEIRSLFSLNNELYINWTDVDTILEDFQTLFLKEDDGLKGYFINLNERAIVERYLWSFISSISFEDLQQSWTVTQSRVIIYDHDMKQIFPVVDEDLSRKYFDRWRLEEL